MWREAVRATGKELRGWPTWLLFAWLAAMLSMPLTNWMWGEGIYLHVTVSVLLQVCLSMALLARALGLLRTALIAVIVAVLSWALEAVGSATGVPFGDYHYTDHLQPQVAHVPVLIPAAWMMMLPPSWAVGWRLGKLRGLAFVAWSGLALTAWDLFLDPQMTQWELWVWDQAGGGYFGIPWANYLGWFLGAALITAVVQLAVRPEELPERPLLAVYTLTWMLETVGLAAFWGLPGPAACGFVGMGTLVVLAWRSR